MTLIPVCCPQCSDTQVVKRGRTSNAKQRYLCQNEACPQQTFVLEYRHRGRLPQVKQQIIDMALNGSGIRDTARVLGISVYFTEVGSWPLLIPLANVYVGSGTISFVKEERRVLASGLPSSQLLNRIKLSAAAVTICCRCVFASPI